MKNYTFLVGLLCLCFFSFSCTNETSSSDTTEKSAIDETVASETVMTEAVTATAGGLPTDAITDTTYHTWVSNWETHGKAFMKDSTLYGFTMPLIDLSSILSEKPDSAYFAIGLDTSGGKLTPKLVVVGVKAGHVLIDDTAGDYAYDFSKACPPFCKDTTSTK